MPGVIINAESTIGEGVILNTACSVDHDCKIGNFVHLGPKSVLCGGVEICDRVLFGTRSVAIPLVKVGPSITIGANSTVTMNISNCTVAVGSPTRPIKQAPL